MNLRKCPNAILLLRAAVLIATVASEASAAEHVGNGSIQSPAVGVFAGKFVDGMPVYQFPPVTVVANRKAQLAAIEREAQLARASEMRAPSALRQPEWRCNAATGAPTQARATTQRVTNPDFAC
jgi:hypothetical protein